MLPIFKQYDILLTYFHVFFSWCTRILFLKETLSENKEG